MAENLINKYSSVGDLFPDPWIRPDDLENGKRYTLTIQGVRVEEVHNPRTNQPEPKAILDVGRTKRLILNKTQCEAIAEIAGSGQFGDWPGTRIALERGIARNKKPTIRIHPAGPPAQNGQAPAAPPPPPAAAAPPPPPAEKAPPPPPPAAEKEEADKVDGESALADFEAIERSLDATTVVEWAGLLIGVREYAPWFDNAERLADWVEFVLDGAEFVPTALLPTLNTYVNARADEVLVKDAAPAAQKKYAELLQDEAPPAAQSLEEEE